jgi:hypothetical protein
MTNITQQEIIELATKSGFSYVHLAGDGSPKVMGFDIVGLTKFAQLIEARLAARSDDRQSEPVYQLGHANIFKDVSKEEYESARYIDKRIVYLAAPQQAIPAEILTTLKLLRDNLAAGAESYKAQQMADKLIRELSASPTAPIESEGNHE